MPTLSRYLIHTAFVYLGLSLLVGVLLAARHLGLGFWAFMALMPVYLHLFLLGWVTQLIFGVAYWMFPRRRSRSPRGSEEVGWAAYGFLNAGLLLRALAEPMASARPGSAWSVALVFSALLGWIAALGWVYLLWPRVRGK